MNGNTISFISPIQIQNTLTTSRLCRLFSNTVIYTTGVDILIYGSIVQVLRIRPRRAYKFQRVPPKKFFGTVIRNYFFFKIVIIIEYHSERQTRIHEITKLFGTVIPPLWYIDFLSKTQFFQLT